METGKAKKPQKELLCPSSRPEMEGSRIFGVLEWKADAPRVGYLEELVPVEKNVLDLAGEIMPTEIFRIASRCGESGCRHYAGGTCTLAEKIVRVFDEAVDELPRCQIRKHCKWWHQEGKSACLRCPQVKTDVPNPSPAELLVGLPNHKQ